MANQKSRLTLWLALAVVLVGVLFVYLLTRSKPASAPKERSAEDRPEPRRADRRVASEHPTPDHSTTQRPDSKPAVKPIFRNGKWFFPRELRNEGEDRPIRGPLPGDDLPPPAIPDKPPVTPMIDPMDVTPEFRAEKTKILLDHLKDRETRLSKEIDRLAEEGNTSSAELQRKRFLLERLRMRQRKITEALANPPPAREAPAARPSATSPSPADKTTGHDGHDHDAPASAPAPGP